MLMFAIFMKFIEDLWYEEKFHCISTEFI